MKNVRKSPSEVEIIHIWKNITERGGIFDLSQQPPSNALATTKNTLATRKQHATNHSVGGFYMKKNHSKII